MKKQFSLLVLAILTAALYSCNNTNSGANETSVVNAIVGQSHSSLVGTYSIMEKGQLKEFIKIEENGNQFTLSEKQ